MRFEEIDVWLEVGREGRVFTYCDGNELGIEVGDIVSVLLKGRQKQGLVVCKRIAIEHSENEKFILSNKNLSFIESVLQKAAVDPDWRKWIEEISFRYHISPFRMLKAALPPGWLGSRRTQDFFSKQCWWVKLNEVNSQTRDFSLRQRQLIELIASVGGGSWQKDLLSQGFSASFLKSCLSLGITSREKRVFVQSDKKKSNKNSSILFEIKESHSLTEEQKTAMKIYSGLPLGGSLLLWGVTGSGKTEVYLQMVAKELSKGNHCLILTPEIGLTPQIVDRFTQRFGPRVLEYHSGCSEKERINTWRQVIQSGEAKIVVGTRSAIFLPLSPLGLIVLDEEHDTSYKQESPMPCYHARDLAFDRAKRRNAKIVLGSATPSLVTWQKLSPRGTIRLARLTQRIANKPLPKVTVVDMRSELAQGHRRLISRLLKDRLSSLPEKGEQAVVLVPRRGYSTFLSCRSCGEVVQCPNCDVSLTVHQDNQRRQWLRCHWCDHRASMEFKCKYCGSSAFKPFGAGTQRVMEHLADELSGLRILRYDKDTTGGRDGHRHLLRRFANGEADVLVGTQMLSKGMDLPLVTLAAVLAADGLLHRPDLSAEEQTLQLFLQLAGRAGRGERPGEVVVQTYSPEHPVIQHLVDGCYEEFLSKEAKLRKEAGLVPFRRACLLRLSAESASVTCNTATALAAYLKPSCISNGWSLIGPAPALVERVSGKSRWQILLHGPESSPLPLPEGETLWEWLPKGVNLAIDPDPLQL